MTIKTTQDLVNEILDSKAKYVKTSVSNESCAVEIAIRDIEGADWIDLEAFEWEECSSGLDDQDY